MSERDDYLARFFAWRGVDVPCAACGGAGQRAYANTAIWRGGIGGQMITTAVCDACWGTGDVDRKGADLRALDATMKVLKNEIAEWREVAEWAGGGYFATPDDARRAIAARLTALRQE